MVSVFFSNYWHGIIVSSIIRVCERRKLIDNVGIKSKVMTCSRYGNGGRMHVILNGESLEEVDYFKYLGSQVATDGGCERDVVHSMNEGYRAWGVLKSVLSNRILVIKAKKCLCEGVIVPTTLHGAEVWGKCWDKESECSWDKMFEKFGWSVTKE